jgi:hypothetical protein
VPEQRDEKQDERKRKQRADEIAAEVTRENPDPVTRREAIEGELEEEGLSDEGGSLGEHVE